MVCWNTSYLVWYSMLEHSPSRCYIVLEHSPSRCYIVLEHSPSRYSVLEHSPSHCYIVLEHSPSRCYSVLEHSPSHCYIVLEHSPYRCYIVLEHIPSHCYIVLEHSPSRYSVLEHIPPRLVQYDGTQPISLLHCAGTQPISLLHYAGTQPISLLHCAGTQPISLQCAGTQPISLLAHDICLSQERLTVWCPTANCPVRTWRHCCRCCRKLHAMLVCLLNSASQQDLPGYAMRPEPTGVSVLTPFLFRSSFHGCISLVSRLSVIPTVAKLFSAVEFLADCNQFHTESLVCGIIADILTIPRLLFGDQTGR